jgi:hypothetical protein
MFFLNAGDQVSHPYRTTFGSPQVLILSTEFTATLRQTFTVVENATLKETCRF